MKDNHAVVSLTGDADLIYHAPLDVCSTKDALEGLVDDVEIAAHLQACLKDSIGPWQCSAEALENMIRGQSVLTPPPPPREFAGAFQLCDEARQTMAAALRAGFQNAGLACAERVELVRVTAFLFTTMTVSISVHLRVAEGWQNDSDDLLAFFGPEGRRQNKAGGIIADVLRNGYEHQPDEAQEVEGPLTNLCRVLTAAVSKVIQAKEFELPVAIPYYHVLYAGMSDVPEPGTSRLAEPFRKLLYLPGPEEPKSQSPQFGEFAFAGDAYSIIAYREMVDGVDYCDAVLGVSNMIQVCEFQYRQLATICDDLQRRLRIEPAKRTFRSYLGGLIKQLFLPNTQLEMLYALERRLQGRYDELTTSTFSRNNRILHLRDAMLKQWGLASLHERANNLISALRAEEARRRDRLVWGMNVALFVIAILTVAETLDSIFSIYEQIF